MHHPPTQPPTQPRAQLATDLAAKLAAELAVCPGGLPVVNMLLAKTHLSRLVVAVECGAVAEILITRHGHPVARLTSLKGPSTGLRIGLAKRG